MKNFLCLYLNTGGGHKAPATVFKQIMNENYSDAEVILESGLQEKNKLAKFLIETMYHVSCNYLPGAWTLFYEFGKYKFFQNIVNIIIKPQIKRNVRKLIREHNCTDIVSFHFLLTPSIVAAVRQINKDIRVTTIVTDPFTAPTGWFYERNGKFVVASEEVKEDALKKIKIPQENITVLPFLINPKFYKVPSESQIKALRQDHNIPENNKVLLITGGGGGLPNILVIIKEFLKLKPNFTILVVCGKDIAAKKALKVALKLYRHYDIRLFGFVSNMDELINLCDCAIIKPGASTLFEVIGSRKPVIISTYLHGQELGNVRFVINNKVGTYIRKPKIIAKTVSDLFNNDSNLEILQNNVKKLPLRTDLKEVADYFINL